MHITWTDIALVLARLHSEFCNILGCSLLHLQQGMEKLYEVWAKRFQTGGNTVILGSLQLQVDKLISFRVCTLVPAPLPALEAFL
jgi:hypothetical protein